MKNIKEQKIFMEYPKTRIRFQENQKAVNMPYMHFHECYEIYIMLNGCVDYNLPDSSFELSTNSFIFINPFTVHRKMLRSTTYTTFMMNFSTKLLEKYFMPEAIHHIISPFDSLQHGRFDEKTAQKIKSIALDMTKSKCEADTAMGIAEIMNILKNAECIANANTPNKTTIEKTLYAYVGSNLDKKITSDTLSENLYISKQALTSQLKNDCGLTPMCFVNKTKMDFAKLMLTHSEFSIERISKFCGFASLSYFSKIFKDLFDETPLKYRKRVQKNEFRQ